MGESVLKKLVFLSPQEEFAYPAILSLLHVSEGEFVKKGEAIAMFSSVGSNEQTTIRSPFDGTIEKLLCKKGAVLEERTRYLEFLRHDPTIHPSADSSSGKTEEASYIPKQRSSSAYVAEKIIPAKPAPIRSDSDQKITDAFDNFAIYFLTPFAVGLFTSIASMLVVGTEITELHLALLLTATVMFISSFTKLKIGRLIYGQKLQRIGSLMFAVGFVTLTIGLGHKINPDREWIWEKLSPLSFFEYQAPVELQRDFNDFLEAE